MPEQGDVKKIMEDAEALQPTFFVAVPRVLERLTGGIKSKVAKQGWLTQILFRWGFHQKLTAIQQGRPLAEVWLTTLMGLHKQGRLRQKHHWDSCLGRSGSSKP